MNEQAASPSLPPPGPTMARLFPLLKGLLGLAGLAVYIELVGGAMLWIRYYEARIPDLQTVQAQSPQFLLETGLVALFVPLLVGAAAAAAQYILCPVNRKGALPPRFGTVLVVMVAFAIYMAVWQVDDLQSSTRWLLVGLAIVSGLAVWMVAQRTQGFVSLAVIFFIYGAIFGACFKLVREIVVAPRFDLAIAFRGTEHRPLAGLYLGRSSDDVLIARLTPDPAGAAGGEWQTVVVPRDQVSTLVIGPRSQPVNAAAQTRADALKLKLVKQRLEQPTKKAQKQQAQAKKKGGKDKK